MKNFKDFVDTYRLLLSLKLYDQLVYKIFKLHTHTHAHTHMYACTHVQTGRHTYIHMYAQMTDRHTYMQTQTDARVRAHTHTHTHTQYIYGLSTFSNIYHNYM